MDVAQLREALPGDQEYKFLLHDRHKTFSAGLDEEVERWGIAVLKSPAQAPTANAFCERLIGSIRRECLDYLIPLNESHLKRTLREWVRHYNGGRPHQSLGLVFQTKLTARCRQTTTINQYPGTDGSSRSQYSAVCITSIDGLMPPDLVTNGSDYANFQYFMEFLRGTTVSFFEFDQESCLISSDCGLSQSPCLTLRRYRTLLMRALIIVCEFFIA